MKKIVFRSLTIGLITIALLMLTTVSATLSAPEGPVVFTKGTINQQIRIRMTDEPVFIQVFFDEG